MSGNIDKIPKISDLPFYNGVTLPTPPTITPQQPERTMRHFDLVGALDMHWLWIGVVPVPIPYPFLGIIFDPIDYVSFTLTLPAIPLLGMAAPMVIPMGGSVKVNNRHKGTTTTSIFGILPPMMNHIGPLVMPPMGVNDGEVYYGSETVISQGSKLSGEMCKSLTCWDPPFASQGLPTNPRKGFKFPLALYSYPMSMMIYIPAGNSVFVGGPKIPHKYTVAEMAMRLVGMTAVKGLGRLFKKAFNALKGLTKKIGNLKMGPKKLKCWLGKDPVNLVTGIVYYEGEDFQLPGPIPIVWERNWYSDSDYKGLLGHGTHCSYDLFLKISEQDDAIIVHLPDGRGAFFDYALPGESVYNRTEKLTLTHNTDNTFTLTDHGTELQYTYNTIPTPKNDYLTYKATKITNYQGNKVTLKYNNKGVLQTIIDSVGRVLTIDTNANGYIDTVSIAHREETKILVQYAYNDAGDIIAITDNLQQSTQIEYEQHLMIKKTDRNGQSFYWTYDARRRCTKTWGDGGLLTGEFAYYADKTVMSDSNGQHTYYFNEQELCIQKTDPMGNHQFFEYNDYQELLREIDEEGNVTIYEYDEKGNTIAIAQPDGSTEQISYNEKNQIQSIQSGEGRTKTFMYDEAYKLEKIKNPDGTQIQLSYNQLGLLEKVVNEQEISTRFEYDADANLAKIVLPDQTETHWKYDAWGKNIEIDSGNGQSQRLTYDSLGRVVTIDQPDGNMVALAYNAYQEVTHIKDRHHDIKLSYTPLGDLKIREENGQKVRFYYNSEAQLTRIQNERSEEYRFFRNPKGEIITERGFDGLIRRYDRDRAGKVVRVTRPEERWSEYEYDAAGRITRAQHYDDTYELYRYDKDGLLIHAQNQHAKVAFTRDAMGRVIQETQDEHSVINSYDELGNRTQLTSSLGAAIAYQTNTMGQTAKIQSGDWHAEMQYNALGQEIERSFGTHTKVYQKYDGQGNIHSQHVSNNGRRTRHKTYHWDVNNRLTAMVDMLKSGSITYTHDDFGNLAAAKYADEHIDYKMPDAVGNIYKTKNRADRTYDVGGKLKKDTEYEYEYDAEGNLIRKHDFKTTAWQYQWYGNGMLKSTIKNTFDKISYEYDPLGRRTAKINHRQNTITRFIWDGNALLHEWEYPLEQRPKMSVNAVGALCYDAQEPYTPTTLTTWVFDPNTFRPTAKLVGENHYSIVCDYLGTPTQAYDQNGKKVWDCELDIYGKVRTLQGDKTFIPFRYQGQYEDTETGLYYNRFRYYSPDSGTYLSQDPIGLAGNNPNLYAYVHDLNTWVDPFGLSGITIADLLKNDPDLLQDFRNEFKNNPEWQGIDPDKTKIQYVDKATVDKIRAKPGESGGHHPHGLALDGPEGQKLTITNETRKIKNPKHSKATGMQRKLINRLKKAGYCK